MTQGKPRPRNTMTELLPVMCPIASSAYFSLIAAVLLAKISGREVPRATKVMAVTSSFNPIRQPKIAARSPTITIRIPIKKGRQRNRPSHLEWLEEV